MAVQILDKPDLGTLLGTGIGRGISALASQKMQQMQMRKGLEFILSPGQAKQVAMLPPQIQQEVIKRQLQTQQQQERMNLFQQQYGGAAAKPGLETLLAGAQQQPGQPDIAPEGIPFEGATGLQALQPGALQQQPQQQEIPGLPGYVPGKAASLALALGVDPGKAMQIEEKAKEYAKKEFRATKKEVIERKKYATEQENKLWDKADPYIDKMVENSNSARENNQELEQLESLEGGLDSPAYTELLKGSGFDLSALKSPESQQFEKIRATFLRDMKRYFPGGKITNQEMEMFLKTLPDLSQSPEGRKRVIASLKRINNIAIQHAKAIKSVIKKNNGAPPRDLKFKVSKIMKTRLNRVAEQFRRDLSKPSPKFTYADKTLTVLGRGVGSIIGAVPKLIGGLTGALRGLGGR